MDGCKETCAVLVGKEAMSRSFRTPRTLLSGRRVCIYREEVFVDGVRLRGSLLCCDVGGSNVVSVVRYSWMREISGKYILDWWSGIHGHWRKIGRRGLKWFVFVWGRGIIFSSLY